MSSYGERTNSEAVNERQTRVRSRDTAGQIDVFNEYGTRRLEGTGEIVLNIRTRNSSPPQRNSISSARIRERTARATARIALSPTLCPSVSLIGFRLSISAFIAAFQPTTSYSNPGQSIRVHGFVSGPLRDRRFQDTPRRDCNKPRAARVASAPLVYRQ